MTNLSKPVPYTASPVRLLWQDLVLFLQITFVWPPTAGIPSIVLPILPLRSGPLDELYLSPANLYALALHIILVFTQTTFLLSLVPSAFIGIPISFYTPVYVGSILLFVWFNSWVSVLLNGRRGMTFDSKVDLDRWSRHDDERWIFINGVAAGKTWLQSNLDRLALTFRRPIHGIHNQTRGIIFDVIECIIQRSLGYNTQDIRSAYEQIVKDLSNKKYKKVVLILHSQGAIEGGMVLDWLYATVPSDQLSRLEVYTFANAANHWNSPVRSTINALGKRVDKDPQNENRVIKHIEHYSNTGDFVSRFGILHFRTDPPNLNLASYSEDGQPDDTENRFVGRLFKREASGHQMNGNYLDNIFRMDANLTQVLDNNPYMDSLVDMQLLERCDTVRVLSNQQLLEATNTDTYMVKDLSRLWKYRNGSSPTED